MLIQEIFSSIIEYSHGSFLFLIAFLNLSWIIYTLRKKRHTRIVLGYVFYALSTFLWVITNAYFQSELLILSGENVAKWMGLLSNMGGCFFMIGIFYISCVLRNPHKKLGKFSILVIGITSSLNLFFNLYPGLTVIKVNIINPHTFVLEQGPMAIWFFLMAGSLIIPSIINSIIGMRKKTHQIEVKKNNYIFIAFLMYLGTICFNIVLPIFFQNYSLVWLPPFISILDVFLVGYGVLAKRFFDLRLTIQNYFAYISNALIYLFLLFISIKLFQSGEITQRILIGHFFIILGIIFFFRKKTLQICDVFWNYVFYRKKQNPVREIKKSLSKFQESFATGTNALAVALGIKKLQFVFIKEEKAQKYQPIFNFFQANPEQDLVKEEIDYTIENTNDQEELIKIRENMQKNFVSAVIPVLNNQKKLIGLLILEQKINGKLFSVQEIRETKKLLKNSLVYLSKNKKNKNPIEKDFITGLMHEIRHPLVMASNLKDMIDWEKLNHDDQKFLSSSQEDLYLLSQNLDKISEAVHWEHQSVLTEKSFGTFQSLFDSLLAQKFEGKIHLKIEPKLAKKIFEFDFHNLKRAFQEIIRNAFFFNKSKEKELKIEVKEERENIILNFSDNGIGIDKKSWDRVFDLLFVEAFSRNPSECGLGVGLTIAKGIILAHDGDIKILKSEKGKGTTFSVSLNINSLE